MFGEFIKEIRLKKRITLREFCKKNSRDPSNWSKIERGILPPPKDGEILQKLAKQLGLKTGSDDWLQFFDLAFAERGHIPSDIMKNKDLVKELPLFFRTLRGEKPTREEMRNLAKLIRGS